MTKPTKTRAKSFKQLAAEQDRLFRERSIQHNLSESLHRARSVSIGTAFGGSSEICLRRVDGSMTFAILQPVEVIELIHQMAASVGCHIHIVPRQDFSSWRNWKLTEEELKFYRGGEERPGLGHPPHSNDISPHKFRARILPKPEDQPGMQPALMARSESNEQTVATQKTVGRKRTKRAAAAA